MAAFYPLQFAAERVGGDEVDVTSLTPPGVEPHDLELSPQDVAGVRSAGVVLYLDQSFQPAVEEAIRGARGDLIDVLAGLPLLREGDEGLDPHFWLDPVLFQRIVRRIGLVVGTPDRTAALVSDLKALDREYRTGLANCRRREIVTSHAAFGYLAHRYGLHQVAITGLSPESEPTPKQLEHVVDEVRASGATTVYFEPLVSPRLAETVARETGAKTAVLNPIEGLTEEQASAGDNYLSLMRRNLAALRKGLGCSGG